MSATSTPAARQLPVKVGKVLAYVAFVVGIVCALGVLLPGPLYRTGVLSLGAAIATVRWATMGAIGGAVMALSATFLLAVAGGGTARRATWLAVIAIAVNLASAGPPLQMYREVQRLPRIHDVTTDTANPPMFVAVVPLRKDARNPVDYKPQTAAEQKKGYPDLEPLKLGVRFPSVFLTLSSAPSTPRARWAGTSSRSCRPRAASRPPTRRCCSASRMTS
jgi:hypothetical protein